MIKALAIVLFASAASIYNSNFESESVIYSILLPVVSLMSLIALAPWMVTYFHRKGINQATRPETGSSVDFPNGADNPGTIQIPMTLRRLTPPTEDRFAQLRADMRR